MGLLDSDLLHHFPKPNAFFCCSFPSESDEYPENSHKYQECPRMPCHLDDRSYGCIYLKTSCRICRSRSDDIFDERIHDRSTDEDEREARNCLKYSQSLLTHETPGENPTEEEKYTNNHKDVLDFVSRISFVDSYERYIHNSVITSEPECPDDK